MRLAAEVTGEVTYLGAHVVPPEFGDDSSATSIWSAAPMLAACAPHARWVDVFCDRGAFGADEARTVLAAGRNAGPDPEGARLPARAGTGRPGRGRGRARRQRITAPYLSDADVAALASSGTVATLLPAVEFSTRQPYPDARRLLARGRHRRTRDRLQSGLLFHVLDGPVVALAVREMGMTTQEAVWAATDRGRAGATPHRRGASGAGRQSRSPAARRPVARVPCLPAGRPAGRRRLAGW